MKAYLLLIPIVTIILISGCTQNQTDLNQKIEQLDAQVKENTRLINLMIADISELKGEQVSYANQTTPPAASKKLILRFWNEDEILAKIGAPYKGAKWFVYIYRDDGSYYDQSGPIFGIDPYYKMNYQSKGDELNVSRLRMYRLFVIAKDPEKEYEAQLESISKATQLDEQIKCNRETICDEKVRLVTCTKRGSEYDYYNLFPGDYMIIARDKGQFLTTFKNAFCTDTTTSLTGNVVVEAESYTVTKKSSLSDRLNSFIDSLKFK